MAKSGHYKELVSGYSMTETTTGISCTRVFIDTDPTASTDLPEIGDSLNLLEEKLKTVLVVQIVTTKHGDHPSNQMYTVTYSNAPGNENTANNSNDLPISGGLSGEAINIKADQTGSLFIWKDDKTPVAQDLFKKILTGTFKVTKRLSTLDLVKWSEYAGKINSIAFTVAGQTFEPNAVLFNGVEFEEYNNSLGRRRWKVGFSFSTKQLPAGVSGNTYYGWNHILDERKNEFREVQDSANKVGLYQTANLGLLISGAEAP